MRRPSERDAKTTRRGWLKGSAAFAICRALPLPTFSLSAQQRNRGIFAYVGTYSSPLDGGGGNGKGIYLLRMDPMTGSLKQVNLAAEGRNLSWISLDPSGRRLYAANEISDDRGKGGSVSAYAVNRENGELHLLNVESSQGAGPAYVSVDGSGKYAFVANYAGGSVAVLPILAGGALGPAAHTYHDRDFVGRTLATDAPPGSFAFSGHDHPHAHMIESDPGNHFVLHTDLGQDRIYVDTLDAANGALTPAPGFPFVSLPSGDGPRHFAFHPNGKWLYSLQEEASTVAFFLFDPVTGLLRPQQSISTLPPEFKGTSFASEILVSPDGRFVYTANRLHDTIAVFSIQGNGRLHYLGENSTRGDYPRHLAIDPSGTFLYACNQRSDDITSFRINRKTGLLTFTGQYTAAGSPACLVFLK